MKRWVKTTRAKSAIAAVLAVAASIGGVLMVPGGTPAAVDLAARHLVKDWEGLRTTAYWDAHGRVWTVCYGETRDIRKGMSFTADECQAMLMERLEADYYRPLTQCVDGFETAPVGVQAAVLSFSWNLGIGATCNKASATPYLRQAIAAPVADRKMTLYEEACRRYTFWNKAGGQKLKGLELRREYGDAERIGEYELCVAGLDVPSLSGETASAPPDTRPSAPEPKQPPAPQPDVPQEGPEAAPPPMVWISVLAITLAPFAVVAFLFFRRGRKT